jgi:hypothetical protein
VILAVTGTPGSGKSFRLVCEIAQHLQAGGWVATNVRLREDWPERLARRSLLTRFVRPSQRERIYRDRFIFSEDVDELLRVSLPAPRSRQAWEGRGLWVLDEAHENLNSRTWGDENRLKVVKWLSRSRHRGWDVRLGTQHFDSLDKQLRDRVEYEELVRNLKRAQIAGVPVVPFNLFLAIRIWRGGPTAQRFIAKRSLYLLDDRRRLYDTHGLRELADDELDGGVPVYFGDDSRAGRIGRAAADGRLPEVHPEQPDSLRPSDAVSTLSPENTNGGPDHPPLAKSADERHPRRGRQRL